jgi:hypothetical protein
MPRVVTFEQYLTSFNAMSSEEEFEYTVSKKDRQQNGHTKGAQKTNSNLQNIHIKLKIE